MTFRAAQHPSTPCDFELVLESGEQVPLYYPGEFFFKVPVEGAFPDIPDGAVILARMVTANAMKMGGDRIDPANLKLWFKAEGIHVVCPCTFGPNCIRDAKGNIFATRAFEVASGW
jgi:hypothetical protein